MPSIMASALKGGGSTRAWRKLRAAKAAELSDAGCLPCWRCGVLVYPGDAWVLGHVIDRALGGDDQLLALECQPCSSMSGARLGLRLRAERRQTRLRARLGQLWPDDQRSVINDHLINDQLVNALDQVAQDHQADLDQLCTLINAATDDRESQDQQPASVRQVTFLDGPAARTPPPVHDPPPDDHGIRGVNHDQQHNDHETVDQLTIDHETEWRAP